MVFERVRYGGDQMNVSSSIREPGRTSWHSCLFLTAFFCILSILLDCETPEEVLAAQVNELGRGKWKPHF